MIALGITLCKAFCHFHVLQMLVRKIANTSCRKEAVRSFCVSSYCGIFETSAIGKFSGPGLVLEGMAKQSSAELMNLTSLFKRRKCKDP
jgi:hypothetical protein